MEPAAVMEPAENTENSVMDRIPDEILVEILSYLSASYMKQARLVCSRWYEASKDILIMKHQKFVFLRNETPGIPLNTLANSNYSCYNLDILGHCIDSGSTLDEGFDSFVESQGSKIYSLRFRKLYFKPSTIEKIMINCINLKELSFETCNFNDSSIDTIPTVNGVQIERKRLKILKFDLYYKLSDSLFKVFINVYPNVEKLLFVPDWRLAEFASYCTERPANARIKYSDFCQTIVEKCKNLKTLNVEANHFDGLTDDDLSIIANRACFKLKELNISGQKSISKHNHNLQTIMKNFLSRQRNIISLDVSRCECFDPLLLHLRNSPYQNLPNSAQRSEEYFGFQCYLEHLNISFGVMPDIPDLLRNTRLKSFQCDIISCPAKAECTTVMNSYLQKLSIDLRRNSNGDISVIFPTLKSFPNLTHLKLSDSRSRTNAPVASYIFTHLVHLETIILERCVNWVDDSAFKNSTGKLKNLKHLNLLGCRQISEKGFEKFSYPKLKYLNIEQCNKVDSCVLAHLAKTSPLLEHLYVSYGFKLHQELSSSMTWEYLRYLFLSSFHGVGENEIFHIYRWKQHCPSLHYINMCSNNCKRNSFSLTYNPESKEFDRAHDHSTVTVDWSCRGLLFSDDDVSEGPVRRKKVRKETTSDTKNFHYR